MALRIDASGDGYDRTVSVPTVTNITACGFLYYVAATGNPLPFFCRDSAGFNSVAIAIDSTTTNLYGRFKINPTTVSAGPLTVNTGEWYFVAVTRAGTALNVYARQCSASGALSNASATCSGSDFTPTIYRIGAGAQDVALAGWRSWEAALTSAELELEAKQLCPVRTANLWAAHMLVGPDSTANQVDISGNGRSLDTAGTATFTDGPPVPWRSGRQRRVYVPTVGGGTGSLWWWNRYGDYGAA